MNAHIHDWTPSVAPDYRCACGATGRRHGYKWGCPIEEVSASFLEAEAASDARAARRQIAALKIRHWPQPEGNTTPATDEYIAGRREEDRDMRSSTRHTWTADEEELLRHHVEVVLGSHESPTAASRARHGSFWDRVSGRFLPDLDVGPAACRDRWAVLRERDAETQRAIERARLEAEEADEIDREAEARVVVEAAAWEAMAQRIAAAEADAADELTAALCGLRADVGELDLRVRAVAEDLAGLLAEWRGR